MKDLKINIFENDQSVASLLKIILNGLGYDNLQICSDPKTCPICAGPDSKCLKDTPCADVLISDNRMPIMNGIELFRLQSVRGCKLINKNMALMSAGITSREQAVIDELDCHFINKPFEVDRIEEWLNECAERTLSMQA